MHSATSSKQWILFCEISDGVVMKTESRQLKFNVRDGQVQTEEFLEGWKN